MLNINTPYIHLAYIKFLRVKELTNLAQVNSAFAERMRNYVTSELNACADLIEHSFINIKNTQNLFRFLSEEESKRYGPTFLQEDLSEKGYRMMAAAAWSVVVIRKFMGKEPLCIGEMTPRELMEKNFEEGNSFTLQAVDDSLSSPHGISKLEQKNSILLIETLLSKSEKKSFDEEDLYDHLNKMLFYSAWKLGDRDVVEQWLTSNEISWNHLNESFSDMAKDAQDSNFLKYLINSKGISIDSINKAVENVVKETEIHADSLQILLDAGDISPTAQCRMLINSIDKDIQIITMILNARPILKKERSKIVGYILQRAKWNPGSSLRYIDLIKIFLESGPISQDIADTVAIFASEMANRKERLYYEEDNKLKESIHFIAIKIAALDLLDSIISSKLLSEDVNVGKELIFKAIYSADLDQLRMISPALSEDVKAEAIIYLYQVQEKNLDFVEAAIEMLTPQFPISERIGKELIFSMAMQRNINFLEKMLSSMSFSEDAMAFTIQLMIFRYYALNQEYKDEYFTIIKMLINSTILSKTAREELLEKTPFLRFSRDRNSTMIREMLLPVESKENIDAMD